LGILAGASLPFLAVAAFHERGPLATFCAVTAAVLFLPCFVYLYILTILHWKDRYKGRHSDLWGALLLIETTGWFKLVYLFRHLLPDAIETVRYGDPDSSANTEITPTNP
jgi:hypothetical protein